MTGRVKENISRKAASRHHSHQTSRRKERDSCECEECRKHRGALHRSAESHAPQWVPSIVHDVLATPGRPMEHGVRALMEERFDTDFSAVRLHTDSQAAASARAVGADAYTVGNNVVFGPAKWRPSTSDGYRLLAHELTHVVQQSRASAPIDRLKIAPEDSAAEREAVTVAGAALGRKDIGSPQAGTSLMLARVSNRESKTFTERDLDAPLVSSAKALQLVGEQSAPIRDLYNKGVASLRNQAREMLKRGVSREEVARFLVAERTKLKIEIREISGGVMKMAAELYDLLRGKRVDPSYEELFASKGSNKAIISGALRTNKWANRLPMITKWLGRAAWVTSAGVSIKAVVDAPPGQRGAVALEEGASLGGGVLGSELALVGCALFGIGTGGLGLVVCGVVGAVGGSLLGTSLVKSATTSTDEGASAK